MKDKIEKPVVAEELTLATDLVNMEGKFDAPTFVDTRPTAIIIFGENNMPVVELKNWGGINAMMIERATYEIHRASHQHRANELHKQNVEIRLNLRNPENIEKENENV